MDKFYVPVLLGTKRIGRRSLDVACLVLAGLRRRERVATELLDQALRDASPVPDTATGG